MFLSSPEMRSTLSPQPPGTLCRPVSSDVLREREAWMWSRSEDDVESRCLTPDAESQLGRPYLDRCHAGNGRLAHINEIVHVPALSANIARGEVALCAELPAVKTNRAAALRTDCSRRCSVVDTPTSTELQ